MAQVLFPIGLKIVMAQVLFPVGLKIVMAQVLFPVAGELDVGRHRGDPVPARP